MEDASKNQQIYPELYLHQIIIIAIILTPSRKKVPIKWPESLSYQNSFGRAYALLV